MQFIDLDARGRDYFICFSITPAPSELPGAPEDSCVTPASQNWQAMNRDRAHVTCARPLQYWQSKKERIHLR